MELGTNELNNAASGDIYFQDSLEDTVSLSNPDIDDDELGKLLAIVVDRMGQPVLERSNSDHFPCSVRNVKSAQNQFPLVTQAKRMVDRTGEPVEERIAEERESSSAQIRTLFNEQRKTIIAEYCEKVSHHEFLAAQAEHDRRILQEELLRQQQDFHEVHQQDLIKMKELQKFQNSTFDEFTKQKFIEDQKIIMELSGRLQELQNEVNCMNDSKDFQDAESVRSGNSHVTSQPGVFPKHPPLEGLLRPPYVSPRRRDGPPNIWDTSGISGNVFAHPQASSSAPYPQELNSLWKKTIEEPYHMSTAEKSERQERDQDLRCQSGPSAKDSVIFSGGDYSKNYGADQQRLQISDLNFDKFPTPATFACWKIRFKTEVCTCSQFPTEAMQWIKEVELVDSVDELRSSSSIRGISMPNFEVLDARIASALNKIIHNSHFKRKISLKEQKAQKDLDPVELETMTTSRSPTTVMTANGEVQTREEATVYLKQLDLFVQVMCLEETPAVLSLWKLCEDHGYSYHWKSSQNLHFIKNGKRIPQKLKTTPKKKGNPKQYEEIYRMNLSHWLQEFRERIWSVNVVL